MRPNLRTEQEIMENWKGTKPVVSICCLAYNHEPYIEDALEGFLIQETDFPFEVLIHDDASTDRTPDIIREYEAAYPHIIKPIYQSENQYSKNVRISVTYQYPRAQGKYIAICEGDDYWTAKEKLQIQYDFMESHSDYSMCFHASSVLRDGIVNKRDLYPQLENRDYTATELFEKWTVPTASIFFSRTTLNYKINREEDFLYGDIKIIEQCAHTAKVYCINKFMSVYRIHKNGMTWNDKICKSRFDRLPIHFIAIKDNFPLIDNVVINKKLIESYLLCTLKSRNIKSKLISLIKALKISPFLVIQNFILYIKRKLFK